MLWGPIGLVLATPLTVCLVVLGRHIERLAFIDILLGDQPALQPWELFYQRMLAGDASEAVEQAEEVLKERRLLDYYDGIALKGLHLAQTDITAGTLTVQRAETIRDTVEELVSDLSDFDDDQPSSGDDTLQPEAAAAVAATSSETSNTEIPSVDPETLTGVWASERPILCIAGRSPVDEAAAIILAAVLEKHGLRSRAHGVDLLTSSNIAQLDLKGVALVCLSCLDTDSSAHIRNLVRRVRRRAPNMRVMLAMWGAEASVADTIRRSSRADFAETDIRRCLGACIDLAASSRDESPMPVEALPVAGIHNKGEIVDLPA